MTTPTVIIAGSQILRESTFQEVDTPSTPGTGKDKLYFKEDGKLYKLNSSGVEAEVGSGTGSSHDPVTIDGDSPLALSGQAISMENEDGDPVTKIGTGGLADSDTEIPSSKAVRDEILEEATRPVFLDSKEFTEDEYETSYTFVDINNKGQILGFNTTERQTIVILEPDGSITEIGKLHETYLLSLGYNSLRFNDKGTILACLVEGENFWYVVRTADGAITTLPSGFFPYNINNKDQVCGGSTESGAGIYTPGVGVVYYGSFGWNNATFNYINDNGDVAGNCQDEDYNTATLIRYADGSSVVEVDFGIPGVMYSYATGISDNGDVLVEAFNDDTTTDHIRIYKKSGSVITVVDYTDESYWWINQAYANNNGDFIVNICDGSYVAIKTMIIKRTGDTVDVAVPTGGVVFGIDNNRNMVGAIPPTDSTWNGLSFIIGGARFVTPTVSATEDGLMTKEDYALLHTAEGDDVELTGTPKVFVIYDGETPYYFKAYPTKGA